MREFTSMRLYLCNFLVSIHLLQLVSGGRRNNLNLRGRNIGADYEPTVINLEPTSKEVEESNADLTLSNGRIHRQTMLHITNTTLSSNENLQVDSSILINTTESAIYDPLKGIRLRSHLKNRTIDHYSGDEDGENDANEALEKKFISYQETFVPTSLESRPLSKKIPMKVIELRSGAILEEYESNSEDVTGSFIHNDPSKTDLEPLDTNSQNLASLVPDQFNPFLNQIKVSEESDGTLEIVIPEEVIKDQEIQKQDTSQNYVPLSTPEDNLIKVIEESDGTLEILVPEKIMKDHLELQKQNTSQNDVPLRTPEDNLIKVIEEKNRVIEILIPEEAIKDHQEIQKQERSQNDVGVGRENNSIKVFEDTDGSIGIRIPEGAIELRQAVKKQERSQNDFSVGRGNDSSIKVIEDNDGTIEIFVPEESITTHQEMQKQDISQKGDGIGSGNDVHAPVIDNNDKLKNTEIHINSDVTGSSKNAHEGRAYLEQFVPVDRDIGTESESRHESVEIDISIGAKAEGNRVKDSTGDRNVNKNRKQRDAGSEGSFNIVNDSNSEADNDKYESQEEVKKNRNKQSRKRGKGSEEGSDETSKESDEESKKIDEESKESDEEESEESSDVAYTSSEESTYEGYEGYYSYEESIEEKYAEDVEVSTMIETENNVESKGVTVNEEKKGARNKKKMGVKPNTLDSGGKFSGRSKGSKGFKGAKGRTGDAIPSNVNENGSYLQEIAILNQAEGAGNDKKRAQEANKSGVDAGQKRESRPVGGRAAAGSTSMIKKKTSKNVSRKSYTDQSARNSSTEGSSAMGESLVSPVGRSFTDVVTEKKQIINEHQAHDKNFGMIQQGKHASRVNPLEDNDVVQLYIDLNKGTGKFLESADRKSQDKTKGLMTIDYDVKKKTAKIHSDDNVKIYQEGDADKGSPVKDRKQIKLFIDKSAGGRREIDIDLNKETVMMHDKDIAEIRKGKNADNVSEVRDEHLTQLYGDLKEDIVNIIESTDNLEEENKNLFDKKNEILDNGYSNEMQETKLINDAPVIHYGTDSAGNIKLYLDPNPQVNLINTETSFGEEKPVSDTIFFGGEAEDYNYVELSHQEYLGPLPNMNGYENVAISEEGYSVDDMNDDMTDDMTDDIAINEKILVSSEKSHPYFVGERKEHTKEKVKEIEIGTKTLEKSKNRREMGGGGRRKGEISV